VAQCGCHQIRMPRHDSALAPDEVPAQTRTPYRRIGHLRTSGVACINDAQMRVVPGLAEFPRRIQRSPEIEAPMD
jgi:hypothetical protein